MWRKTLAVLTAAVILMGSVPATSYAASGRENMEVTEGTRMQEQGTAENTGGEAVPENPNAVSGNEAVPELPEPIAAEDSSSYMDADAATAETVEVVEKTPEAGTENTLRPYEGAAYSLTYRVNDSGDGITITGITDYASKESGLGRLVIPEEIDGLIVTEIGEWAFGHCSGLSGELVLPEGLIKIGKYAFYWCSNFSGDLIIPAGVTEIGEGAFCGCRGFSGNLMLPKELETIGASAFEDCSGFTGELVIPDGVTTIYMRTFRNCSGFNGNLVLPEGLVEILGGEDDYEKDRKGAFYGCSGFRGELILPERLEIIGENAFYGCSGFIGNLVIPEGVTKIGSSAFWNCSGFSGKLVLPGELTEIHGGAFHDCSGFNGNLVLPEGLTEIGSGAFDGCSGFSGELVLPEGLTTIYSFTFNNCSGFSGDLIIPTGVTEIGQCAFYGCSGFNGKLVLPKRLAKIRSWAFSNCGGFIGELVLPEGLTRIEDRAFTGCNGFSGELVLPKGLTAIGNTAFMGCSGFAGELVLPEGLATIGAAAFKDCSGFTGELALPEELTTISALAFYGCSGLTSVTVLGRKVSIDARDTYWENGEYVEYGVFGPISLICGYPGSTAETYAETNGCTFIPLTETAAQDAVEFISSIPDTNITVPMQEGAKLSLLSSVLADRGLSDTAEETALEITVSEAVLQGADKQTVDSLAASRGMTAVQYLDISMKLRVGSEKQEVTRTSMPVRFVVDVPQELQQEDRRFSVVRLHDGQTRILEDMDNSPDTVTIETDRFSSYTLVYRDGSGVGSLTGTAVSFPGSGSSDGETVLVLKYADGSEAARTTVAGTPDSENKKITGTYILDGLAAGTYTLQASRDGHTTREYTVTIIQDGADASGGAGMSAVQDVELWLKGDVSGDGKITALDKKLLFNHMAGAAPLAEYALSVGDVSGDGKITALDKKLLFNHMAGTTPLW